MLDGCRGRLPGIASRARLSLAARSGGWRWCSSTRTDTPDEQAARAFVQQRGFSEDVARGVLQQLSAPDWGVRDGGLLEMVRRMAGRFEVGEDAGLVALAKAVEREQAAHSGKQKVRFWVQPPRGARRFEVEGLEGMSLRDVREHGTGEGARLLAELLECACSGVMACSTCHVYVDAQWRGVAGEAEEAEEDMLDLAYERKEGSRLGCPSLLRWRRRTP